MPNETEIIAHDSIKRLLERPSPHTEALYNEVKSLIPLNEGGLVIDDSTSDKLYSHQIELLPGTGAGNINGLSRVLT